MNPDWLHDYIVFVLRLNRLIVHHTGDSSLLDYYGPPAYQTDINREPVVAAQRLVHLAQRLEETVADQGFAASRTGM